ncbi:hypothetical protein K8Z61_17320 [Nocardioides sp. TRM66260-LWL]|uniref:hypothetical protein n=1 Tax=Nocardioides sp. TRM66260-LWL TaxID=2874478 RepID=UPI001CC49894|nr:hypothetical protein [Nocardioides sp. TRM66260-LWL]MBZ5736257.1 hypothetical protein [Nocardioides sp. TRM66260-LWL]
MTPDQPSSASVVSGRRTFLLMIPINLLMVPWVWIGRVVFGVFGWFGLVLIPVALVVLAALTLTTVLAFVRKARPRGLTRVELIWQWLLWGALLVFGAVLPDFGDTEDSTRSALTQAFGYSDRLISLSFDLAVIAAGVAVVAWIGLLVSLLAGSRTQAISSPGAPAAA